MAARLQVGESALSISTPNVDSQPVRPAQLVAALRSLCDGVPGKIAGNINEIASANDRMAREPGCSSNTECRVMEDSFSNLLDDVVCPTTEVTRKIGAVTKGGLTQTMALEVEGHPLREIFELKNSINMVTVTK